MTKKHSCPYCGNNPVPHYLNWYFDTINILFERLQVWFLCNPIAKFLSRWEDDITLWIIGLGRLLFMIKLAKKPGPRTLDRARVLWEEAEKRGLEMREVRIFDRGVDLYIVRKSIPGKWRKKIIIFSGIPRPYMADQSNLLTLDDKWIFKKTCEKNNLPIAHGGHAFSFQEAKDIFDRIEHPIIVKPRLGSRGRHVVTYVRDHDDLYQAYKIARQLCLWVMVEEQLYWPVYRATVIDYKLAGVLSGTQPQVLWDGKSTLSELLEEKNKSRDKEIAEVKPTQSMAWFLKRQLSCDGRIKIGKDELSKPWKLVADNSWDKTIFEYVPKKNEVVYLSEKIGLSYGGNAIEEYDKCHPDNRELFERAARVFGDPIVGFDFMIADISQSWKTQRCGFLEANSVPFINLHHHPHQGKPRNIAARVWDLMGL